MVRRASSPPVTSASDISDVSPPFCFCFCRPEPKQEYSQSWKALQQYGNLTYELIPRKLNWTEAVKECGQRGGHLASVHDGRQSEHLGLIAKRDGFPLWLGLSNQDVRTRPQKPLCCGPH